jgi:hypothetical protein
LSNPTWKTSDGKHYCKHVSWDTNGFVDNSRIEIHVRI